MSYTRQETRPYVSDFPLGITIQLKGRCSLLTKCCPLATSKTNITPPYSGFNILFGAYDHILAQKTF